VSSVLSEISIYLSGFTIPSKFLGQVRLSKMYLPVLDMPGLECLVIDACI